MNGRQPIENRKIQYASNGGQQRSFLSLILAENQAISGDHPYIRRAFIAPERSDGASYPGSGLSDDQVSDVCPSGKNGQITEASCVW